MIQKKTVFFYLLAAFLLYFPQQTMSQETQTPPTKDWYTNHLKGHRDKQPKVPLKKSTLLESRTQLTSTGGYKNNTDWSQSGDWIAFEQDGDIWLVPASGGTPVNLTGDLEGDCSFPKFTSDSQYITFTGYNETLDEIVIWSVAVNNYDRVILDTGIAGYGWSADGNYYLYTAYGGTDVFGTDIYELRIRNEITHESTVLESGPVWYGSACISPDNETVYFSKEDNAVFEQMFKIPRTGGVSQQLTSGEMFCVVDDVSPNGKWVLFSDWYNYVLYAYNTETDEIKSLFQSGISYDMGGSFSPTGLRLSFSSYVPDDFGGGVWEIFTDTFPFAEVLKSITVISPNGGEVWPAGSSQNIKWTSTGVINVKLDYSTNNGSSWTQIVANTLASIGNFAWAIPNIQSSSCLIRVSDASNISMTDTSNAVFTIYQTDPTFVSIPGGTFQMGDVEGVGASNEKPVHTVTVSGFEMSENEVTNAQYNDYLNEALSSGEITATVASVKGAQGDYSGQEYIHLAGGYDENNKCWITFSGGTFTVASGKENWPVVYVTWYGAKAFAGYYGYDLPREAEWEYACRGGQQYMFGTDDGTISSTKAHYNSNISHPIDVASFPANPFGLYDMSGNVWEWCYDWFGTYPSGSVTNPTGPQTGTSRVGRGGCWNPGDECRSADRGYSSPVNSYNYIGFRVVRRVTTPTLTLVAPNGGETLIAGNTFPITWTSSNIENVKLEWRVKPSAAWEVIIDSVPAIDGSLTWTVPSVESDSCQVKVTALTIAAVVIEDISNGYFTIVKPSIRVIAPNGAENWEIGSQHAITWESHYVDTVSILYSTTGLAPWTAIAQGVDASLQTYMWTIPETPSTECKVLIVNEANTEVFGRSWAKFTISEPTVTKTLRIITPNGGENLTGGTQQAIEWQSTNVATIKIEYTTESLTGAGWQVIAQGVNTSLGSYLWTVPNTPSTTCRVRVTDESDASLTYTSYANFTISVSVVPQISVISPNGGESWTAGGTYDITWESYDVGIVNVVLATGNTADPVFHSIVENYAAGNNVYSWTIPDSLASNECKIVIEGVDAETWDESDDVFSIVQPAITVTAPIDGEQFIAGTVTNITWTSLNIQAVKLEWRDNPTSAWQLITDSVPAADGTYEWAVPDAESSQCQVKISSVTPTVEDVSDGYFSIALPSLTITSPNGSEQWDVGSAYNITWSSAGVSLIKIEYSVNSGNNWTTLADSFQASLGSYEWTVPSPSSVDCLVRITNTGNPARVDVSDHTFIILPDPRNTNAILAIDTDLTQYGFQGNNPITGIGGNALLGFALYAKDWSTSRSFNVKLTWNSTKAIFRNDVSKIELNGENMTINGRALTLSTEGNVLMFGAVMNITYINETQGNTEATLYRTDASASTLAEGFLFLPVFRTATTFGVGDSLVVKVDLTVTDKLGNEKALIPRYFKAYGSTPTITVTSPISGDSWEAATLNDITWTSNGIGNVKIEYSVDNGVSWIEITPGVDASLESYLWTVPRDESNKCKVKVTSASDATVFDTSDTFAITTGDFISVLSPTSGLVWTINSNKNITWSFKNITNVKIELSRDNGSTWEVLETGIMAQSGSYQWTVSGNPSSTCKIRLSDSNRPQINDTSDTFEIILPEVTITHTPITSAPELQALTFTVTVTGTSAIQSVNLYYRTVGTNGSYTERSMNSSGNDQYTYTIPSGYFTVPGLEYCIVACDVGDIETRSPADVGYYAISAQVNMLIAGEEDKVEGGSTQNSFRMISIPLDLAGATIQNVTNTWQLGTYGTDWRLFRFPQGGTSYNEYPNIEGFSPGKAFWIIAKDDLTIKSTTGKTVPTDVPFEIILQPGWNDIANPWMFDIPWDSEHIEKTSVATLNIYTYAGMWVQPSALESWKGYAVYKYDSGSVMIKLHSSPMSGGGKMAAVKDTEMWRLTLEASAGLARDTMNYLGVRTDAKIEWDEYDGIEPPGMGEYVSLTFPHRDWTIYPYNYTMDFRPPNAEMTWDFDVTSTIPNEVVTVRCIGSECLPCGCEVRIFDRDTNSEMSLVGNAFRFTAGDVSETRHFSLKVVTSSEPRDEEQAPLPKRVVTAIAYPNPFNPRTTIQYELPEGEVVTISIYNALGQKVFTNNFGYKESGIHEFNFDASELTSGLYFYHVDAGYGSVTGKMVLMK